MEPLIQQQFTDSARRDQRLLGLAYRRARRMGDYRGALQAASIGDQMGLRVGMPGNDQELKGTGFQRMRNAFAMNGMNPPATGLDAFDFRHSSQGGPGVGGYNFNQRRFQNDPVPIQGENLNPDQNNPQETRPVIFGNPAQTQPVSQQKPSGFLPTPEEVAQFQRERRLYGSGAKVPELQKPSQEDQGIALRIAQRRNYLRSLQNPIDKSFGVPEVGTRISDMGGRGVAQNPQFSPEAWKRFDQQQALDKAFTDAEIQQQYDAKVATLKSPDYKAFEDRMLSEYADSYYNSIGSGLGVPPDSNLIDRYNDSRRRRLKQK